MFFFFMQNLLVAIWVTYEKENIFKNVSSKFCLKILILPFMQSTIYLPEDDSGSTWIIIP